MLGYNNNQSCLFLIPVSVDMLKWLAGSSGNGGNGGNGSTMIGRVYRINEHQVVVEDILAEGTHHTHTHAHPPTHTHTSHPPTYTPYTHAHPPTHPRTHHTHTLTHPPTPVHTIHTRSPTHPPPYTPYTYTCTHRLVVSPLNAQQLMLS